MSFERRSQIQNLSARSHSRWLRTMFIRLIYPLSIIIIMKREGEFRGRICCDSEVIFFGSIFF